MRWSIWRISSRSHPSIVRSLCSFWRTPALVGEVVKRAQPLKRNFNTNFSEAEPTSSAMTNLASLFSTRVPQKSVMSIAGSRTKKMAAGEAAT